MSPRMSLINNIIIPTTVGVNTFTTIVLLTLTTNCNSGAIVEHLCLHKQSTRKLHRTWDGSTEVSPRPEYRRLYGGVRCGPLRWMRDPTLKQTLTLYPGPHAAARLDPPLHPRGSVSKRKGKGGALRGSAGQWVGGRAKTGKLPKHWRCKQKLRRGTTSVCTSRAQENCTGLGYSFSAVPRSHTTGPTTGSQPQRNVN